MTKTRESDLAIAVPADPPPLSRLAALPGQPHGRRSWRNWIKTDAVVGCTWRDYNPTQRTDGGCTVAVRLADVDGPMRCNVRQQRPVFAIVQQCINDRCSLDESVK